MGYEKMTTAQSKSVFFSTIQIASFVSISVIVINLFLKPFDISMGTFTHEEITAISLILMNGFVMIQRLKPQSPLYFIKEKVNEVASIIKEASEQNKEV